MARRLQRLLVSGIALAAALTPVRTGAAAGLPTIALSPAVGPPTSAVIVHGSGFAANDTVILSFEGLPEQTVVANGHGGFRTAVRVPVAALPGEELVSAVGESSGATAETTFLVRANWPMERFDSSRAGVNPYENVLDRGNVHGLSLAWSQPIGSRRSFAENPAPAVSDGVAFAASFDALSAFDSNTGELRWRRTLRIDSSPAVVDGVVYTGGNDLRGYGVSAFDAASGARLWTFTTAWLVRAAPAIVDGVVYVGSEDGNMYALDAATGHKVWASPVAEMFNLVSSPAVADGRVYLAANGAVEALDASTGTQVWGSTCGRNGSQSAPAVVDGVAYFGGNDGNFGLLCALDAATGEAIWTVETGSLGEPEVAVDAGVIYMVTNDGILALDAATGTQIWARGPEVGGGRPPALANGVLYVPSYRRARAFDSATGATLWTVTINSVHFPATPVVVNGQLFVSMADESLFAFELP